MKTKKTTTLTVYDKTLHSVYYTLYCAYWLLIVAKKIKENTQQAKSFV